MTLHRRVLVVSCNSERRELLQRWLSASGYVVHQCDGFESARQALQTLKADLLVTDVRLRVFNGLHLIIWSRGRELCPRAVLVGEPDPVLQKEAERERATYVPLPLDEMTLLDAVAATLTGLRSARRYPRVPVALTAEIDGRAATVTDLSYDGVRIELRQSEGLVLPEFFTVRIADGLVCRLQRVWWRRPHGRVDVLLCGSKLPGLEPPPLWRQFVDAITVDTAPAAPVAVGGSSI